MKLPPFSNTIAAAAMLLLLTVPRSAGATVVLVVPIILVCMLYLLARLAFKRAERRTRAIQLGIWVLTLALIAGVQSYWTDARQSAADKAAAAVLAHKQRTGNYPATLAETGLDEPKLRSDWGLIYRVQEGKPKLQFTAQAMFLSWYEYDFEKRTWTLDSY